MVSGTDKQRTNKNNMCNPKIPSVTLQTAILLQVKEFAESGKVFSAHDITRSIRDKCNTGKMEIPEVEDLSGADGYRFNVDHAKVRNLFNEMRDNGVFDAEYTVKRNFNGMYFDYTATAHNVATPVSSTASPPTKVTPKPFIPAPANIVIPFPFVKSLEIKRRIVGYLGNCTRRNFRPSLKHIQSAIKRGNHSTGVSSADLLDLIRKDLGYSVSHGPDIKHTRIIV